MTHDGSMVVVVDDDDGVRLALEELLRAVGFSARGFGSAEALLAADDVHDAACVIADINLPGKSGVALAKALASERPSIPTVLISARDDANTRALVRSAGTIPFLRKPFSDEELVAAMSLVMRKI